MSAKLHKFILTDTYTNTDTLMQYRQTNFLTDPIMSSPTQTKWCSAKSFKEFLSNNYKGKTTLDTQTQTIRKRNRNWSRMRTNKQKKNKQQKNHTHILLPINRSKSNIVMNRIRIKKIRENTHTVVPVPKN